MRKGKKIICRILAAAALAAVLGGCAGPAGGGNAEEGQAEGSVESAGGQESASGEEHGTGAYPIVVENYGRKITISKRPEKVLTLGPNCTELFAALGLEDLVIGRSLVNHSRGPLEEYAQAVESIPQLNYGSATREAILTSGADFIYALDWEISDQGCNLEEAAQYGITVYVNTAANLEEQYQEILDMGKIFGVEEKAKEFVEDQKSRIQAVQDSLEGKEPVEVLVYDLSLIHI